VAGPYRRRTPYNRGVPVLPALPSGWAQHLSIGGEEIGPRRRPGNAYTRPTILGGKSSSLSARILGLSHPRAGDGNYGLDTLLKNGVRIQVAVPRLLNRELPPTILAGSRVGGTVQAVRTNSRIDR